MDNICYMFHITTLTKRLLQKPTFPTQPNLSASYQLYQDTFCHLLPCFQGNQFIPDTCELCEKTQRNVISLNS